MGRQIAVVLLFVMMSGRAVAVESRSLPAGPVFALHLHGSVAADMPGRSNNAVGFGWVGRAGYRVGPVGLFVLFGVGRWLAAETALAVVNGTFIAGTGAEYLLFDGRVRIAVAAGTSTLLFDAAFHDAGATGFFVDLHPGDLRFKVADWLFFHVSPLTFTLQMPGTGHPALLRLEYRTELGLEVPF